MTQWEPVIGLEVHVQLGTATKAFSPAPAGFGAAPNTQIDPVVLGLPGCLPVFNRQALEYALLLGVATKSEIRTVSRFARKHYFYPDLPKGYQISQYDEPLLENGVVEFYFDGKPHTVNLERIHLEEDAGKNTHQLGSTSLVDLNRAGMPLCEIVTRPDLRSAEEAAEYMRALRQLVRYLGISEGNMEQGHLRCDANVSLRPVGQEKFGTRAELKNINSFRFVQKAIEHEIRRQAAILDDGGTIVQETRLWDANAGVSISMRSKEEANDYRYFPDPDLPPLVVSEEQIVAAKEKLPQLPMERIHALLEKGLTLDDARVLTAEKDIAGYFDETSGVVGGNRGAKLASNWIQSEVLRELNQQNISIEEFPISAVHLGELISLIEDKTISGKIAKDVFERMLESGDSPSSIVEKEGLTQITDTSALEEIAADILAKNENKVLEYQNGKVGLLGFFVGQLMKATQGKANPKAANEIFQKLLERP